MSAAEPGAPVLGVSEAPAFGEASCAFVLAENTDGSTNRVSLGTVTATDPDGDTVSYALAGDDASERFELDASSGELYYVGSGEDFEDDPGPFSLTVRAGDATHTVDTSVTVTVTDVQGESEPAGEDLPAGRETSGVAEADEGSVSGRLGTHADRDWFAVTLEPGRGYAFSVGRDTPGGGPTPVIRALRDANGDPVPGIVSGVEVRYTTDATAERAVYYIEVGSEGGSVPGTSAASGFGPRSVGTPSLAVRGAEPRNTPGDSGTDYHLTVWTLSDDYLANRSTRGTVAVTRTCAASTTPRAR